MRLREENKKLLNLISYFRTLSVQYDEDISALIQNKGTTTFENLINNDIKKDIITKNVEEEEILIKSPKSSLHSSTEETTKISHIQSQHQLLRNSWGSKSASALPICGTDEKIEENNAQEIIREDPRSEKRSTKRRKSRSPTSRASLLIRKQKSPLNKTSCEVLPIKKEKEESPPNTKMEPLSDTQLTLNNKKSHCIILIFRSNCYDEQQKFFKFIASYTELMKSNRTISWYRGLCSIKKQGHGSCYIKGEPAKCGTWENNCLIESHHNFLPEELISNHMDCNHSLKPSAIISPIVPKRKNTSLVQIDILPNEEEKSLFDGILPDELKILIFSFLDLWSLVQASLVSTEWKRLTNDPSLWCSLHIHRWGGYKTPNNVLINEIGSVDWQDAVKTKHLLDRNWRLGDCYASTLRGHSGWVTCVDMHHNRLVSCSYDGTVKVWNTQTGNSLQTFPSTHQEGLSPVWCVQCKGNTIMSGSSDSLVRQWNMTTGQCVREFEGHAGGVKCLQVSLKIFCTRSYFFR